MSSYGSIYLNLKLCDYCRSLDKAAIKTTEEVTTSSKVCTVTEVEETKLMIRLLPVWLATIIPSTMVTLVGTLFVKQAATLDRHMGNSTSFEIPAASTSAFLTLSMLITTVIYDRILTLLFHIFTRNPKGITSLHKIEAIKLVIHFKNIK